MTNVKEHLQKEHESLLARSRARLFRLVRDEDETGVSGTGVVAEGVEFSNGTCALSWLTPMHSVGVYPGMRQLEAIHGHDGRTRVEYAEPDHNVDVELHVRVSDLTPLFYPTDWSDDPGGQSKFAPPLTKNLVQAVLSMRTARRQLKTASNLLREFVGPLTRFSVTVDEVVKAYTAADGAVAWAMSAAVKQLNVACRQVRDDWRP